MKIQNINEIENKLDKKVKKRGKKKKKTLKVSGASVKKIQKIIKDK